MSDRIVPSRINAGDSVRFQFTLPDDALAAGESWQAAQLDLVLTKPNPTRNTPIRADATLTGGLAEVFVPGATTAGWADGIYRYRLTAIGDASQPTTLTIECSVVDVADALTPKSSFNERMVALLEAAIEEKVEGRGDVLEYTITSNTGSQEFRTMSLQAMQALLNQYRTLMQHEQGVEDDYYL